MKGFDRGTAGRRTFRRPRRKCGDNIEVDLKEIVWMGMN
jgi:hypothetical protein